MLELATKQQTNTSVEGQFTENGKDEHRHHQPHHITDESSNGEYEAPIHSTKEVIIKRKLLLLSPLLICLYILTDTTHHVVPRSSNNNEKQQQHLAFVTALSRHPPALRVFRIISESAFLLFCTAFALWAWEMCSSSSSRQDNDESLEQFSNLNNNHKNSETTVSIPSQTVGKLLFSPPPNSITDNVAWMIYKKHHHRVALFPRKRKGRRKMRGLSNNSSNHDDGRRGDEQRSRDEDDLIELQQQHPKVEDDEQDVSPLMDTTPSRNTGKSALHDRLRDDHDDNYIENDENGNRNEHPSHNNTETTLIDSQEETLASSAAAPKPPSSTSVLGAALDITTVMCMFLIFFTISSAEGGRYIDHKARGGINISPSSNHIHPNGGENDEVHNDDEISYMKFFAKIAAPLFPITLFLLSILLLLIPWRKRKTVWTIVSLTLGAPFYEVTFRDGFIGDILTSTVRPLQDLAYTVVFLFLGLQAWWDSQAYINTTTTSAGGDDGITTTTTTTTMDDVPLERSWILHTIILPACTLSPLWWRFLQNLRQCYDTKRRWPYLGNAFKYMMAAEVAIFGMFDPSLKTHPVWIGCFFGATLYQVWWDVFMDWGLLVWDEDGVTYHYYHSNSSGSGGSGSRKVFFWWWPYKLRSQRAYPYRWIYYIIFSINFCLRFVGMLTLIPPVYLSRRTGLIVNTWYDNADVQLFVGSLAALAEIFRRTIWALLRLEWEVIKTTSSPSTLMSSGRKKNEGGIKSKDDDDDDLLDLLGEETDMKPMAISSSSGLDNRGGNHLGFLTPSDVQRRRRLSLESLSDMSNLNDIQILSELCAWATIFSGIAIIAAAHREVL